jgi:hypothetical protein
VEGGDLFMTKNNTRGNESQFRLLLVSTLFIAIFAGVYSIVNFRLFNSHAKNVPGMSKAVELSYDPVSPSYIEVADNSTLNAAKGFTVETWFRPSEPNFNGYLFSKSSGSENGYTVYASSELIGENQYSVTFTFGVADAYLAYHATRNITTQYQWESSKVLSWHHVAAQIAADGKMDIFIDGIRSTMNTNSISNIWVNSQPLAIGARRLGPSDINGYIKGSFDELRVSSVARYPENFTASQESFVVDENTKLLMKFEDNTFDASGQGANGMVFGNVRYVDSLIPSLSTKPTKKPLPTKRP